MQVHKCIQRIFPALIMICLISACSAEEGNHQSYKETKSMVLDILKTEEAQKAIEKAAKKGQMKATGNDKMAQLLSSPEGQQIQEAVRNTLTSPEYEKHLEKLMTDPKFAGEFAKAVQKENKQIHKELMKDPEYQTLLLDIMKGKDFETIVIEAMKGKEYRKETMNVLEDALKNPIFRLELMELMKKAIEEESKSKEKGKGKGKDGEDDEVEGKGGGD